MNVIYQTPDGVWNQATLKNSTNSGYYNMILPDGNVFSMLADGSYGYREAGADEQWEQGKRSGSFLVYTNWDAQGVYHSYPVPVLER